MLDPDVKAQLGTIAEARASDPIPHGFSFAMTVVMLAKVVLELDEHVDRLQERLEFLERPEDLT